ncbi:hypothetical protein ACWD4T_30705, partial [Streptomyces umbrinus]
MEAGEIELDRRVIAREEFVDALAASAAETTAVTEAEGGGGTVPTPFPRLRPRRFRGRWCRPG